MKEAHSRNDEREADHDSTSARTSSESFPPLFPSLPQHFPKVQLKSPGNPQQGVQRGHPHASLDKGDGLLGKPRPPSDFVHGKAQTLTPLTEKAGSLFADFNSCLVVQQVPTMGKKGLTCLLTKVRPENSDRSRSLFSLQ